MSCAPQSQPQCLQSGLRTTCFFVVSPQTETGLWRDIRGTWLPLARRRHGLWFHVSPIQVTGLLGVFDTVFMFSFWWVLCEFGINTFDTLMLAIETSSTERQNQGTTSPLVFPFVVSIERIMILGSQSLILPLRSSLGSSGVSRTSPSVPRDSRDPDRFRRLISGKETSSCLCHHPDRLSKHYRFLLFESDSL